MFGSILVLASSVARAASKYHLLLRDPHFSVIAVLVSSTAGSRRNVKRFRRGVRPYILKSRMYYLWKSLWRITRTFAARLISSRLRMLHGTWHYNKFKYFRVYLRPSTLLAILLHINDGAASHAIATWTVYVVLQKYFDPGRRSSIEFHEMKPPLHASLRPFRKAPIGRIRGATRRDRVARNTCHRRKFRSCVVYHARFGAVIYNTSQYLVSVCIRSAADRPPLNGVRKVESEMKNGRVKEKELIGWIYVYM